MNDARDTIARATRLALGMTLAMACQAACGKPVELFGARLDLPFDFHVLHSTESRARVEGGVEVMRQVVIQPSGVRSAPDTIAITDLYVIPDHPDIAAMISWQKQQADRQAHAPGVISSSKVVVDGHELTFVQAVVNDPMFTHELQLSGVVDGAIFRLQLAAGKADTFSPEPAALVQSIHLEAADAATVKQSLSVESAQALPANRLETPLGSIGHRGNADFSLSASSVVRDADGLIVQRVRTFRLNTSFPPSLILPDYFTISFGCGKQGAVWADDVDRFVQMKAERANGDVAMRFENVKIKPDGTLMRLPAQSSSADGWAVDSWRLHRLEVHRWAAKDGNDWYFVSANRYNGSPIENAMIRQLADAPATCKLDLPWGANMPPAATTTPH